MTHLSPFCKIADQDPHGRVKKDQSDTLKGYLHCYKSGSRFAHVIWRSVPQSVGGCGRAAVGGGRWAFCGHSRRRFSLLDADHESLQSEKRFRFFLFCGLWLQNWKMGKTRQDLRAFNLRGSCFVPCRRMSQNGCRTRSLEMDYSRVDVVESTKVLEHAIAEADIVARFASEQTTLLDL